MNNQGKKGKSEGFTHNSDQTGEVPTLTTLLNRKKLMISSEPKEAHDVTRTNLNTIAPSADSESNEEDNDTKGHTQILPAQRDRKKPLTQDSKQPAKSSPQRSELLLWDPAMMAKSPNPFANALSRVMKLIPEGLYMAITQEGGPERRVPLFKSHAAFTLSEDRMHQLTGIYWDPEYYPDLWKSLLQTGVAETGPGTHEPLKAKFGYQKDVTMLIALVGPANACRGLAVFASKDSIREKALAILGPLYVIRKTAA